MLLSLVRAQCAGLALANPLIMYFVGRREKDMRQKFADVGSNVQQGSNVDKSQGAARAISSFIDPGLNWKDIEWFKSITKMPLVLKVRSSTCGFRE